MEIKRIRLLSPFAFFTINTGIILTLAQIGLITAIIEKDDFGALLMVVVDVGFIPIIVAHIKSAYFVKMKSHNIIAYSNARKIRSTVDLNQTVYYSIADEGSSRWSEYYLYISNFPFVNDKEMRQNLVPDKVICVYYSGRVKRTIQPEMYVNWIEVPKSYYMDEKEAKLAVVEFLVISAVFVIGLFALGVHRWM